MNKKKLAGFRQQRYAQKLEELEDRTSFIQKNLGEKEAFVRERMIRKAMYKEFQELAEILSDLSAMLVKDCEKAVEDDYSNIEKASGILKLDENLLESLKKANGLRNVLIHEYNGVIDKQAYDSIKTSLSAAQGFGKAFREWLKG